MGSSVDLGNNTLSGNSILCASHTSTQTGAFVDTQGYQTALVVVDVTTISTADGSNLFTFTVTGSDVAGGSSPVSLPAGNYTNPTDSVWAAAVNTAVVWDLIIDETTATNRVYTFGVDLKSFPHRYINVVATATGSPSSIFGAQIVMGKPMHAPTPANAATSKTA